MKLNSLYNFINYTFKVKTWKRLYRIVVDLYEDKLIPYNKLNLAEEASVHTSVIFRCPENILIGKKTRIQPHVCLWASPNAKIIIGDYSGLGPHTMLFSSNHQYKFGEIYIQQPWVEKDIVIGKNVWVGSGCIIMSGVTIGEGSVIAAGSVVTKDIPPLSLAAGIPAKVIKG